MCTPFTSETGVAQYLEEYFKQQHGSSSIEAVEEGKEGSAQLMCVVLYCGKGFTPKKMRTKCFDEIKEKLNEHLFKENEQVQCVQVLP